MTYNVLMQTLNPTHSLIHPCSETGVRYLHVADSNSRISSQVNLHFGTVPDYRAVIVLGLADSYKHQVPRSAGTVYRVAGIVRRLVSSGVRTIGRSSTVDSIISATGRVQQLHHSAVVGSYRLRNEHGVARLVWNGYLPHKQIPTRRGSRTY